MKRKLSILVLLMILTLAFSTTVSAVTKFKASNATLKKVLNKRTATVVVNNKDQRFVIKTNEITKFQVLSKRTKGKTATVKVRAAINRKIATVSVNYTYKYKWKSNKWKLSSVTQGSSRIQKINLKGTWKGTYVENQGLTRCRFVIKQISKDGFASGMFYFSAAPTNPKVPSGSYSLIGGYDLTTGKVVLEGNEWIVHPSGYNFCDFTGYLDLYNKCIVGNWNLKIKRA